MSKVKIPKLVSTAKQIQLSNRHGIIRVICETRKLIQAMNERLNQLINDWVTCRVIEKLNKWSNDLRLIMRLHEWMSTWKSRQITGWRIEWFYELSSDCEYISEWMSDSSSKWEFILVDK